MLCSPRKPSSTMRIFSSAEHCFRVARRMSFTTRSDDTLVVSDFCLICASPWSYDEREILPSSSRQFCPTSADGKHPAILSRNHVRNAKRTGQDQWPAPIRAYQTVRCAHAAQRHSILGIPPVSLGIPLFLVRHCDR